MLKKFFCALLFILPPGILPIIFSQPFTPNLEKLSKEITRLTYSNKYDSAQSLVLAFLDRENLTSLEIFYGHYFFADILKSSGRPSDAISRLNESKKFLENTKDKKKYESLIAGNLAECYFNLSDFKTARKHAKHSIQLNPDSSLRSGGHAVNYIILGYGDYLEKNHGSALSYYNLAIREYLKTGEFCELPLCYMKIAKAYNSSGYKNLAEENIKKAIHISDSCKIKNYKLLSEYTLLDIFKENKMYKEGLATLEEINDLVENLEFEKQRQLMNELEVQYETKIAQSENDNLKEINRKNEEILAQQKNVLAITIFAVSILSALLFLLYRVSIQRKKALVEIRNKNLQIEKQNKELERLHQLNQKIFSVISHDFRGPIISLQLLLKALQSETLNAEQISDYTSDLSHQLIQMKNVLENLLNWAKTELNTSAREEAIAAPFSIANEISSQQKSDIEKKGIKIVNLIPEHILLQVPPDILRIVFRNLLSNAIKFSYENSEIILEYDEKSNSLSVKDYGVGISQSKLEKLFSHNVEPSLGTRKENGFGFGLYITRELLHRFKGKIRAERNSPRGTILRINIPPIQIN